MNSLEEVTKHLGILRGRPYKERLLGLTRHGQPV
jgi:hypothetical protein